VSWASVLGEGSTSVDTEGFLARFDIYAGDKAHEGQHGGMVTGHVGYCFNSLRNLT
jgi:hypothetical protein